VPTVDEMSAWALEQAAVQPAGRCDIQKHFGCTESQSRNAAKQAKRRLRQEPVEITAPALSSKRKFDPTDPAYRGPTINRLRKRSMSLTELAEFLGTDEARALDMVRSLKGAGYNIEDVEGQYRIHGKLRPDTVPKMLDFGRLQTPERVVGIVADTHIVNTHQRLDALEMAYEAFKLAGVERVFLVGNSLDGYKEAINADEVYARNCEDQKSYLADHYAQRAGIQTDFITGECHEGWWAKSIGINIGESIEDKFQRMGRTDMHYIGHLEKDIKLSYGAGSVVMRLFHPGGGTAYAQSYKAQKIVGSYQGGEKPHILVLGHYHKLGIFYPRGVWCILAGCLEDQTRWMRKQSIEAHVGFTILRFRQDKLGGISGMNVEQVPFYDRGYHLDAGEWEPALCDALAKSA